MKQNEVQDIVKCCKVLEKAIYDGLIVSASDEIGGWFSVHMSIEKFNETFQSGTYTRFSRAFPWKKFIRVDGVEFFCLMTEREYEIDAGTKNEEV